MISGVAVKICGLTAVDDVRVCVDAGVRYVGFNFFPKSPRYVTPVQAAELASATPEGVAKVGLTVNASNVELDQIVSTAPLDMLQLHGKETPERIVEVKARYGLPVIKAFGIADEEDLYLIDLYSDAADQLLVDAKPPKTSELPGGNGLAFDWRLLAGRKYWRKPWILAGGLTPENVAEAIRMTGAQQVDTASGVEGAPGRKDADLIRDFVKRATG